MKLLNIIDKLMTLVIRLGIAVTLSYISAKILLPIAYAQRGYVAYGGEWILIFLVFGLSMYLTSDKKKSPCRAGTQTERIL